MSYAVITDRTPTRCTVVSLHDDVNEANQAAEQLDTGINGMPADVLDVDTGESGPLEPGLRAYHDGTFCWS